MISAGEIEALADSGRAAVKADQGGDEPSALKEIIHLQATDTMTDVAWYLHTRGFTESEIDNLFLEARDKFSTEHHLTEGA